MAQHIHFVGIGGIGMSALAQLFAVQGHTVTGSDRSESPVTTLLQDKGITVHIGHNAAYVTKEHSLLVYSDAVLEDNPERLQAREFGIRERSYFEALGEATKVGRSIVVTGTHGKTTTTGMIAKVLIDAGLSPTVIAGSILKDFASNFVAGTSDIFVIEGCEYRRHFTKLHPHVLVITNVELDHTDYYRNLEDLQAAFRDVVQSVSEEGSIVCNPAASSVRPTLVGAKATIVSYPQATLPNLLLPGTHNTDNARAAKCAVYALQPNLNEDVARNALASFQGTWRRFEYKGATRSGALLYDDYAHHPTAMQKTIETFRVVHPNKQLVVVFHPHLYSRTKSFFDEFAAQLACTDHALLLPIYAAREPDDSSVSSELLCDAVVKNGGKCTYVEDFEAAAHALCDYGGETVIVTMGAGDVYKLDELLLPGCSTK